MKIISGPAAFSAFENFLKDIKGNTTYFTVTALPWETTTTQAPWLRDSQRLKIMTGLMSQVLGADSDKATFFSLPTGSIIVMLDHATHDVYQKAKDCLENLAREVTPQYPGVRVAALDLSVDWNPFVSLCKEEYRRIKELTVQDHAEILRELGQKLAAASDKFSKRPEGTENLRLLFVEDDPSTRHLLNGLLGEKDVSLRFAENGQVAIREYCERPPHLVFLDINLPDVTGLELLELIHRHDPQAYPVMLTSSADMSGVSFAKEHGVKGYIVKPFSLQKVQECLSRYIASR